MLRALRPIHTCNDAGRNGPTGDQQFPRVFTLTCRQLVAFYDTCRSLYNRQAPKRHYIPPNFAGR
jgi:hypothetical protein